MINEQEFLKINVGGGLFKTVIKKKQEKKMLTHYRAMITMLTSHIKSDRGASMVEYALLVGLIAVVAIVGVAALGGRINQRFSEVSSRL